MAAKFRPSPDSLKKSVQALERSEKKFERWRNEGSLYNALYVNDFKAFNADAPGGMGATAGRSEAATVVRNGTFFAVRSNVRRKKIKNPRYTASPEVSMLQRDLGNGQPPVEVESSMCAYAQSELMTYMDRCTRMADNMDFVLEQGEIFNEAWMKVVTASGADAPETLVYVDPDVDDGDFTVKKIKAKKPVNSLANARFPSGIFVSVEDIIVDADATCDAEINRITHRIVKPLSQMKTQEVDDYELQIDPKTGALVSFPVIDEKTGQVKKRKKYENLEGLEGNYQFYLDKLFGSSQDKKKPGDIRNMKDGETEYDPKDYIVFFEENGRFPCDSGVVQNEFGGVPKTIDGFVYFWKVFVEKTSPSATDDGPTLIRFEWYPVDMGGFALERYQPMPKAASQKGFSWIRNAHEAQALENYWDSYDTSWYAAYKPVIVWNSQIVDNKTITAIQAGEHFDNILADVKAGMSLRDAYLITEFKDSPQGVQIMKMRMRAIQEEASGSSANQRLQSNDASATQTSIIAEQANDQTAYEIDRVKDFVERIAKKKMRVFRAMLPDSGRFEVPGADGVFTQFDRMQLDLECAFHLEYASFAQQPNPVQTKQLQELIGSIVQTPPQTWEKMMPMWEVQAMAFTPAVYAAFRKFVKNAFTQKPDTDPNREHLLMAAGIPVEPDQNENFVETIPQHKKMLDEVVNDQSPLFEQWNKPIQSDNPKTNGKTPRTLLAMHWKRSADMAIERGMGPALGLMGDQGGMQRKQRGSGPESGRQSQDSSPDAGGIEAGASAVPSAMEG